MSITKQLSLFIDVVQQGSFSKAAALHNMDNSLLSKQIKKLEQTLNLQLLNRSTRSFSLTQAGEEVLQQAHIVHNTLDNIQNIADSYQTQLKGVLRITSSIYFGQSYLQPVITQFMRKYPEVKITLFLEDRKTNIISDHFDVAFRVGKLAESNLIAKKIASTHFAIIASEDFIAQHGEPETPEALMALPAVIYSNSDVSLDYVYISKQPHSNDFGQYKMQGNYRVSDVRTMIDAVKAGLGYTYIDLFNLDASIAELKLLPLLTNYQLSTMNTGIYAIYPHRNHPRLITEFIKAVQKYIGAPPFWLNHIPNYSNLYR